MRGDGDFVSDFRDDFAVPLGGAVAGIGCLASTMAVLWLNIDWYIYTYDLPQRLPLAIYALLSVIVVSVLLLPLENLLFIDVEHRQVVVCWLYALIGVPFWKKCIPFDEIEQIEIWKRFKEKRVFYDVSIVPKTAPRMIIGTLHQIESARSFAAEFAIRIDVPIVEVVPKDMDWYTEFETSEYRPLKKLRQRVPTIKNLLMRFSLRSLAVFVFLVGGLGCILAPLFQARHHLACLYATFGLIFALIAASWIDRPRAKPIPIRRRYRR